MKLINLIGKKYGDWTVLERVANDKRGQACWLCRCKCGTERTVLGANLRKNLTNSCRCGYRLEMFQASFNSLLHNYKKGARRRAIQFDLSKEEFRRLTSDRCHYCGVLPSLIWTRGKTHGYYRYNGIDRINNNRGYVSGNVVTCCIVCNRAKRTMDYESFCKWIAKAYRWLHRKRNDNNQSNQLVLPQS